MTDYYVQYIKLPYKVKGVTIPNDDGTFNIFINSIIPPDEQEKAYLHELHHIENDDFYNEIPASIIERIARSG